MKRILAVILIAVILLMSGCGANPNQNTTESKAETSAIETTNEGTSSEAKTDVSITSVFIEDPEFGGAILETTVEDFNKAGFTLGDGCDLEFSNGVFMESVPYYNGCYGAQGAPVIVAYPGNEYIIININYGTLCKEFGLKDGDSVKVTLTGKGKYLDVQETVGQSYSNEISEYGSTEDFCNFRAMSGGNLKDNYFYRGASPFDNKKKRAAYVDEFLKEKGVRFILNLADKDEEITEFSKEKDFNSPYALSLFANGNTVCLDLNAAYQGDTFKQKLVAGLLIMIEKEGPVYIHCLEGKDRTGFVCFLLEALAGASYSEMKKDYMLTYKCYYKITEDGTPKKFKAIAELYFDAFAKYLYGTDDMEELITADYTEGAERYLKEGGMSDEDIQKLKEYVCK